VAAAVALTTTPQVQQAQQTQAAEVEVVDLELLTLMVVQAVAVSSSSAIQTHSEPLQAQQVHQQSLWLEAFGSTNSQPTVLLRFNHAGLG
jgi:hypothetical protein